MYKDIDLQIQQCSLPSGTTLQLLNFKLSMRFFFIIRDFSVIMQPSGRSLKTPRERGVETLIFESGILSRQLEVHMYAVSAVFCYSPELVMLEPATHHCP